MPERITAYRCKYRCGHRVNTKKEAIRLHEKICFSNRKTKACKTCSIWDRSEGGCHEGYLKENEYAIYNCHHWRDIDDVS